MTVMTLTGNRPAVCAGEIHDAASLHARLAGRWAILFSHPEDFAQEQLEMDRWVAVLARSFTAHGVVPVALARPGPEPEVCWLARLAVLRGESSAVLALDTRPGALAGFSGALRAQIVRGGPRFAMILDSSLRCRRTLSYRLPTDPPSPLELIGWAIALRKRDRGEKSPCEIPGRSLPITPAWVGDSRCPWPLAGCSR